MNSTTPSNEPIAINEYVRGFAIQIGGNPLGLAHHRPEAWAEPGRCFRNARRKSEYDGGRPIYGWTFHLRFAEGLGHYLIATHHAVWHSPDGTLVDVTPFHSDDRHHPITENGSVLFLVDYAAQPIEQGNVMAPLPLKFFPVTATVELNEYVRGLAQAEEQKCREIMEAAARA